MNNKSLIKTYELMDSLQADEAMDYLGLLTDIVITDNLFSQFIINNKINQYIYFQSNSLNSIYLENEARPNTALIKKGLHKIERGFFICIKNNKAIIQDISTPPDLHSLIGNFSSLDGKNYTYEKWSLDFDTKAGRYLAKTLGYNTREELFTDEELLLNPINPSIKFKTTEIKKLAAELNNTENTKVTIENKPLSQKERQSLLKMIIVMASELYDYDPKSKRSTTVKDIKEDLERADLPLSDDTIRKFLNEAKELLPPKH